MGGGRSYRSAYYGIRRKLEISQDAIYNTGEAYGVRLIRKHPPAVSVVNAKDWEKKFPRNPNAVGIYFASTDTFYIQRKYFAGRSTQNVTTHEFLHSYAGPKQSIGSDKISGFLEEGIVEYLTQATRIHGYKRERKVYAGGYKTYPEQVNFIKDLMSIVGRKKVLRIWKKGFLKIHPTATIKQLELESAEWLKKARATDEGSDWMNFNRVQNRLTRLENDNTGYKVLARALDKKKYKQTAKLIRTYGSDEEIRLTEKPRLAFTEDMRTLQETDMKYNIPSPLEPGDPNND